MTAMPLRPVVLRNGVVIDDPLGVVLGFLTAYRLDVGGPSAPGSFGEADLRLANRDGARISAAEIAAILERRRAIEPAVGAVRHELARRGYGLAEVRILDLLILSAEAAA